jgi:hypothetical protein
LAPRGLRGSPEEEANDDDDQNDQQNIENVNDGNRTAIARRVDDYTREKAGLPRGNEREPSLKGSTQT